MFDPNRSKPDLLVRSAHPFNAEPPLDRLLASPVTAQADFYVRSHGDIPHLNPAAHRLLVGGRVATPLDLSVAELRERFPVRTVTAVPDWVMEPPHSWVTVCPAPKLKRRSQPVTASPRLVTFTSAPKPLCHWFVIA